jgi:hypothetical protein
VKRSARKVVKNEPIPSGGAATRRRQESRVPQTQFDEDEDEDEDMYG